MLGRSEAKVALRDERVFTAVAMPFAAGEASLGWLDLRDEKGRERAGRCVSEGSVLDLRICHWKYYVPLLDLRSILRQVLGGFRPCWSRRWGEIE